MSELVPGIFLHFDSLISLTSSSSSSCISSSLSLSLSVSSLSKLIFQCNLFLLLPSWMLFQNHCLGSSSLVGHGFLQCFFILKDLLILQYISASILNDNLAGYSNLLWQSNYLLGISSDWYKQICFYLFFLFVFIVKCSMATFYSFLCHAMLFYTN